jgi:hemoglobin-like flavoprotein
MRPLHINNHLQPGRNTGFQNKNLHFNNTVMTDRNMLIIKTSWSYVLTQADEAGALFYEKLFETDPDLRAMFPMNMEIQVQKLMDMITIMVTHLQSFDAIKNEIESLAIRHVAYGVKTHHYKTVGTALLWALEHSQETLWDEQTNTAWSDLYELWSSTMIAAAEGSKKI